MSKMETEEPSKPGRGILLVLGIVGILLGGLIGAELAIPLQPSLGGNNVVQIAGPVVTMPAGVGSNLQANFGPPKITVIIGVNNTVTFRNLDTAIHTVTATGGGFDSGNIAAGANWNYTFTSAGDFAYFCKYHSWMKGDVVVKQGGGVLGSLTVRIPSDTGANPSLNYLPATFTVVIGVNNTVNFVNLDSTVHTVTATDGSFDSGDISVVGGTWTHTFTTPGTYSFHCKYHTWMTGTITVVAA
jgi:plastocyanin